MLQTCWDRGDLRLWELWNAPETLVWNIPQGNKSFVRGDGIVNGYERSVAQRLDRLRMWWGSHFVTHASIKEITTWAQEHSAFYKWLGSFFIYVLHIFFVQLGLYILLPVYCDRDNRHTKHDTSHKEQLLRFALFISGSLADWWWPYE